jgi:hypothetical protein
MEPTAPKTRKTKTSQIAYNPHVDRMTKEHCYCNISASAEGNGRMLPHTVKNFADYPNPSQWTKEMSPDKVLEYASAVLSDGLLLLEFRDAVHEGDGERVMRCWRLMLLYFLHSGHRKYALEAFLLQASINGSVNKRLAQEILHNRFINTRGGLGRNIPTDLHMEHLNRTLKDYLNGLGANISDRMIVQTSKSLKSLMEIVQNFDAQCGVNPVSLHHTTRSSKKDQAQVLSHLTEARIFEYIPGRYHSSFATITSRISDCVNFDHLMEWIKRQQMRLTNSVKMKTIYSMK